MAFVGFAVMNPIAAMAMLDSNRWRPVVYADTPRCKERYSSFLNARPKDSRKSVLFLFGVTNLHRVQKDLERFYSVLVFDDVQNLHRLKEVVSTFDIADIDHDDEGQFPRHLSPAEMGEVVAASGGPPKSMPLVTKLTAALGQRKPSVLESTSRMPTPLSPVESGAQKLLADIKTILVETDSELPFTVVVDNYIKLVFRLLPRTKVTGQVTKKLPAEAKELWSTAIDFAMSPIGERMAVAFRSLCQSTDPDYRIGHAVNRYDLKSYSGDFIYFTSIMPPDRGFEFPSDLDDIEKTALGSNTNFKPSPPAPKAKKTRAKKA